MKKLFIKLNIMFKKSIFIFFIILLLSVLLFFGKEFFIENKKEKNMYFVKVYDEIGKYKIGKRNTITWNGDGGNLYNSICDLYTSKCLTSDLGGFIYDKEVIYIYFVPFLEEIKYFDTEKRKVYQVFEGDKYVLVPEKQGDIKQFGIFTQNSMNFYSLNELKNLPKEDQNILLDLKRSPRFIFE